MTWVKGQNGNPVGKPLGSGKVNGYRKLLESRLPELVDTLINLAVSGDTAALKLCFERLIPAYRAESIPINLGLPVQESLVNIGKSIIDSISNGDLSAEQGTQVLSALTNQAKLVEVIELEQRIKALEEATHSKT